MNDTFDDGRTPYHLLAGSVKALSDEQNREVADGINRAEASLLEPLQRTNATLPEPEILHVAKSQVGKHEKRPTVYAGLDPKTCICHECRLAREVIRLHTVVDKLIDAWPDDFIPVEALNA